MDQDWSKDRKADDFMPPNKCQSALEKVFCPRCGKPTVDCIEKRVNRRILKDIFVCRGTASPPPHPGYVHYSHGNRIKLDDEEEYKCRSCDTVLTLQEITDFTLIKLQNAYIKERDGHGRDEGS